MFELNFDELDMLSPFEKFKDKITRSDLKPESKILLMTHNDLDGSGPAVLLKSIFVKTDVIHCSNNNMDREIMNSMYMANKYDAVFITDISCTKETAEKINEHYNRKKLYLLDHHRTAEYLNEYDWAFVLSEHIKESFIDEYYKEPIGKPSATSITFDFLKYYGLTKYIKNLSLAKELAFMISAYDSWDWVNVFEKDPKFLDLNTVFWIYQPEIFDNIFSKKISEEGARILDKRENFVLMLEKGRNENYINSKRESFKKCVLTIDDVSYKAIYCFADSHTPELFEVMKTDFPEGDIAIINTGSKLSFRSIDNDINVEKLARKLGGGGHINASGVHVSSELQKEYMEKLLTGTIEKYNQSANS
ncbi:DHH family phosphoesterase [Ruminococcus albus]|uniref:Phosphoesterase DHHA1 n=1 Tax=Ruminococcus albus (strain ATCC 27210 / DSM 20455 / JCM 14654 / NCDO 2250 / 7) TaxID=697329 RepID=E6UJU2_RUMA7|nr:phosphoesterase DHHA1 [Ruminococcus albus]ADU23938.1 phosphoesterase DHHA1 [Ruminococcus albus 7 = DSM 20455]